MFNRPIIWYFLRSYRIILRTTLAFTVQMSQNSMRLNRTTVGLNRVRFVRVHFHILLFWQPFMNHILFFRVHKYFVASARALFVKGA